MKEYAFIMEETPCLRFPTFLVLIYCSKYFEHVLDKFSIFSKRSSRDDQAVASLLVLSDLTHDVEANVRALKLGEDPLLSRYVDPLDLAESQNSVMRQLGSHQLSRLFHEARPPYPERVYPDQPGIEGKEDAGFLRAPCTPGTPCLL